MEQSWKTKTPSSSLPHSFSNFSLWYENMTRKIKENLTAFMTEFSSFETWTLSFQIINEPHGFNWDGFFLGNRDEGIRDPFPEGWPMLRLLICICWNERLSQIFFFFFFFSVYLCLKKEVLFWITNCHGYGGLNSRTRWPKILRWRRNFTLLLMILQYPSNHL